MLRLATALTCAVVLASGCTAAQEAQEGAERAGTAAGKLQDCAALAAEVTAMRLEEGVSRVEAERAARRLEQKVREIDSADIQRAGEQLSARAAEYARAAAQGDTSAIDKAGFRLRESARSAAESCGLPAEQFGV